MKARKAYSAEVVRLMELLTTQEIRLLSKYLYDADRQREIAKAEKMPQTSVSFRIRRAAEKLRSQGVPVHLPGRGRRSKYRIALVDPSALERLQVREDGVGHWDDSRTRHVQREP